MARKRRGTNDVGTRYDMDAIVESFGQKRFSTRDLTWIQETRVDKLTEEQLAWAMEHDPSPENRAYFQQAFYRLHGSQR